VAGIARRLFKGVAKKRLADPHQRGVAQAHAETFGIAAKFGILLGLLKIPAR
jgi:hypothetical protein